MSTGHLSSPLSPAKILSLSFIWLFKIKLSNIRKLTCKLTWIGLFILSREHESFQKKNTIAFFSYLIWFKGIRLKVDIFELFRSNYSDWKSTDWYWRDAQQWHINSGNESNEIVIILSREPGTEIVKKQF